MNNNIIILLIIMMMVMKKKRATNAAYQSKKARHILLNCLIRLIELLIYIFQYEEMMVIIKFSPITDLSIRLPVEIVAENQRLVPLSFPLL